MNNKLTNKERKHLGKVKELPCSVCDQPGPSEAHHVKQGQQFTTVALCTDCHKDWHGNKNLWRIYKMDELSAINKTVERLINSVY